MRPIAIFYHCYMSGGSFPVNFENALRICATQLDSLNCCELSRFASHISIGVNGGEAEYCAVAAMAPERSQVHHNPTGSGELPTMRRMQEWCRGNPGWSVLYFHMKGVIHNGSPIYEAWRQCMENTVIWNWRSCVWDLENGKDSVGTHWLTPDMYPFIGPVPYWGGNFWWATSDFLNTLPEIIIDADRYQAEVWIGKGPRKPRVRDYARHFPMSGCHA